MFVFNANATPQIRDELRVYDQVFQVDELPLDSYSEIDEIVKEEHKGCSASWRGYHATWEIVHDELSIKEKDKLIKQSKIPNHKHTHISKNMANITRNNAVMFMV